MTVKIEKEMAEQLLAVDWSGVISTICVKKQWRYADLARALRDRVERVNRGSCGGNVQVLSAELGRIARLEIGEPRVTMAVKLMDMYQDITEGD